MPKVSNDKPRGLDNEPDATVTPYVDDGLQRWIRLFPESMIYILPKRSNVIDVGELNWYDHEPATPVSPAISVPLGESMYPSKFFKGI